MSSHHTSCCPTFIVRCILFCKDVSKSSARKVSQYLAQAMGCYLEAIQCAGDDKSRVHLAKCLWMLTKDGDSPGVLCQTLQTRGALLPSWIWLPWIPQLLSSLYRVEACAVKAILAKIVKRHPQSLYFSLRAFYLERRDIDRSQNPESSSNSQQHSKIPSAVYHSEELFSSLRGDHYTLWISLEAILDQLIVSFRPSYEEEFLQTISALLQRVESQTKHPQKDQSGEGDSVVTSFFKTISKIASKYFRTDTANTKDGKAKKTSEFRRRYKEDFEADFSIQDKEDSGGSHLSLEEVALRLNKWKNLLLVQVSAIPSHIPMQQLSSKLSLFCGEAPDLWSGACDSINSSSLLSSRDRHSESEAGQAHSSPSSSASAASRAAEAAASAVKMGAAHEGGGHCGVGSNLVEIPGQYVPNDINALDTEPRPELHAKLIRFEPTIQTIRRNDQLIRRIGMVGSDGKVYHFLLQFGIPYWTRTDERTAQLHYLTGKILGRGRMSSRRYLSVKSTAVIPIAQRLRMTADDTSDTSLDDVFHRISDIDEHDPSVFYQEEEGKLLTEKKGDNLPKDKQTELERAVKLQVFETVCKTVKSDLLLNHMRAALDGPEQLFQFRRSFTTQLAANSLMQYVFAVVERTPSKFIFNIQNGRVLAPDFRFAYDKQGRKCTGTKQNYSGIMCCLYVWVFLHYYFHYLQDFLKETKCRFD
jgi:transformation/transcription domain-associated protein